MHKVIAREQTWHEAQFAMLTVTIPLRTGQWEEQQYQKVPASATRHFTVPKSWKQQREGSH